ncbi:hypothetical protein Vretimale_17287 [Volvox reticuliferus]|uniref:tRNA:m(4)X modification enzyme TRM13 n=1 Tax=Volvox reticuliferus TaxID=1737510 RepID=A0A8J4CRY0_9CHLO|nr:hypothetical protein Vretifemale_16620 [Volvox reticuliferus]GIM14272.1 hypothetical protein Vretimale_17287 [Volvox reticuliferus]
MTTKGSAAGSPHDNPEPGRCRFFLGGKKSRFCRTMAIPGKHFCGNHLHVGDPDAATAAPQRVPCPLDPNHTVLASELKLHVSRRCPALALALRERAQPHFVEDVNVGSDAEPNLPTQTAVATIGASSAVTNTAGLAPTGSGPPNPAASAEDVSPACLPAAGDGGGRGIGRDDGGSVDILAGDAGYGLVSAARAPASTTCSAAAWVPALGPFQRGRAAQRAALARSIGEAAFMQLLARVEAAHTAVCGPDPLVDSVMRPAECEEMLAAPSQLRPFDLKHGLQQASIVGNMQRVGLISPGQKGGAGVSVVELGAGKGYLGATLATNCGVDRLVATDVKSGFKLKADRRVRHIIFGRYRVDLKDYVPSATPELSSAPPGSPWVAVAKHLCGAATDYGLRACMIQNTTHGASTAVLAGATTAKAGLADATAESDLGGQSRSDQAGRKRRRRGAREAVGHGRGEGTGDDMERCKAPGTGSADGHAATGVLVEVQPHEPQPQLIRKEQQEQQQQEWQQLCQQAQGEDKSGPDSVNNSSRGCSDGSGGGAVFRGLAVAPCCHHRCGWRAYTGKPLFRRLGLSATDFELISWMTGWALCGHDTPAGAPVAEASGGDDTNCELDGDDGGKDGGDEGNGGGGATTSGHFTGAAGKEDCTADARPQLTPPLLARRDSERTLLAHNTSQCDHVSACALGGNGGGHGATTTTTVMAAADTELPPAALGAGQKVMNSSSTLSPMALPRGPASDPVSMATFDPVFRLPRALRMAVGQKCKQLIDAGRLDWLRQRFRSAELVSYIGPEVTGENRLLLAVHPLGALDAGGDSSGARVGDGYGCPGCKGGESLADQPERLERKLEAANEGKGEV